MLLWTQCMWWNSLTEHQKEVCRKHFVHFIPQNLASTELNKESENASNTIILWRAKPTIKNKIIMTGQKLSFVLYYTILFHIHKWYGWDITPIYCNETYATVMEIHHVNISCWIWISLKIFFSPQIQPYWAQWHINKYKHTR